MWKHSKKELLKFPPHTTPKTCITDDYNTSSPGRISVLSAARNFNPISSNSCGTRKSTIVTDIWKYGANERRDKSWNKGNICDPQISPGRTA